MKRSHLVVLTVFLLASACGGGSGGIGAVSCSFGGPPQPLVGDIELVVPGGDAAAATVQVGNLSGSELGALRSETPTTTEEWHKLLRVSVVSESDARQTDPANQLPVAGTYSVSRDAIVFTPMFGFDPGQRYRVEFDRSKLPSSWRNTTSVPGDSVDMKEIWLPRPEVSSSTIVDRVYPTADAVPENQLRLYIHFSAPMGLKGGLDYITLLDPEGVEVKDPFLPLDTEFWNGDRTRFTVFFDPGRVKRGILPNKEMGRSLTEGRPYTLVVSREWRDGQGLPLKEDFRRVFKVGPPDEKPLDQKTWRVQPPRPGTRHPLAVTFPEPLDHGLLNRALGVQTGAGGPLDGETRIEPGETRWTFTPREPWKAGDYRLRVLTILEDLAGNRIGRAFEVDQFERADRSAEPEEVSIPFRVNPS